MDNTQMNLTLLGDCKRKVKHVNPDQVRRCEEVADALRLAFEHSTIDFTQVGLGQALGLGNGNSFKAWLKPKRSGTRPRHFDFNLVNDVQDLVGNDVLSQWVQLKISGQLYCDLPEVSRAEAIKEELYRNYLASQKTA